MTKLWVVSMVFVLAACSPGGAQDKKGADAKAAPAAVPVTTIDVAPRAVPVSFDAVGRTEGSREVQVRARVSGIIEQQLYNEGDAVPAGAPLFRIERAPFELDVHQAQGALSDALVQRRDAERLRALIERQLATLTGRLDLKLGTGDLFALPLPPTPPPGLPSALLERRPDIRSAEQSMIAANAQIGIARAALFPTISLTAALGAQSGELGQLLASGAGIWSLGFGLALPIFDGGRREARVEQAEARREQALAGYQRSIESAFREASDALVNVEQSAASEEELRLRLQAARSALELSSIRYESGYSPYLEVLDAQRTANDAELAFVRNRQARLAFSVDLMKALGGGWR